jgi:hypothetical protein
MVVERTADPSTSLRFGRDDKGEGGRFDLNPMLVERTADHSTSPDFLLSAMGSKKFMRLSLMKAAHEVIFGAAW